MKTRLLFADREITVPGQVRTLRQVGTNSYMAYANRGEKPDIGWSDTILW